MGKVILKNNILHVRKQQIFLFIYVHFLGKTNEKCIGQISSLCWWKKNLPSWFRFSFRLFHVEFDSKKYQQKVGWFVFMKNKLDKYFYTDCNKVFQSVVPPFFPKINLTKSRTFNFDIITFNFFLILWLNWIAKAANADFLKTVFIWWGVRARSTEFAPPKFHRRKLLCDREGFQQLSPL